MRRNVLLVLLCLLPLSGCAGSDRGREPENTVFAQVVGVDYLGGVWHLTAAGKDESGKTVYRATEGGELREAFDALPGAGERWMSVTGVSDLLIGDGAELREVLLLALNNSGMSWRANVWHAPIAAAVMTECPAGGGDRLTVLKESGAETITVLDALAGLEDGGSTKLPALTVRDGELAVGGTLYYERREKNG